MLNVLGTVFNAGAQGHLTYPGCCLQVDTGERQQPPDMECSWLPSSVTFSPPSPSHHPKSPLKAEETEAPRGQHLVAAYPVCWGRLWLHKASSRAPGQPSCSLPLWRGLSVLAAELPSPTCTQWLPRSADTCLVRRHHSLWKQSTTCPGHFPGFAKSCWEREIGTTVYSSCASDTISSGESHASCWGSHAGPSDAAQHHHK